MRASQSANSSSPQMALSTEVRASRQSKLGATFVGRVGSSDDGLALLLMQSARSFGFAIDAQGRMSIGCAALGETDRLAAATTNNTENKVERITPNRPSDCRSKTSHVSRAAARTTKSHAKRNRRDSQTAFV
jgi:hypothetical protein